MVAHNPNVTELDPEPLDDIEFLRRGLLLGDGFQLYLVGAESIDARQRVIEALLSTPGLVVAAITASDFSRKGISGAVAEAFAKLSGREGRPVVVVSAIDELVADDPHLLTRLNEQRSQLITGSAGAVVLFATPRTIAAVRRLAPDTWSVRSADLDVSPLGPTTTDGDTAHHLRPIQPAQSLDERWDIQTVLEKSPPDDETGRAALRLAELYEYEGAPSQLIADLYLQAAKSVKDRWVAALSWTNAARALTRAGDQSGAVQAYNQALQAAEGLDHGMRAYVLSSLSGHYLTHDAPADALNAADKAIQEAAQSPDRDLLTEARLSRARTYRRLSLLDKALADLRAAETEASATGNLHNAQSARLLLGAIAVETGLPRQAEGAWQRFLENAGKRAVQAVDAYAQMVAQIGDLVESSAPTAALQGWTTLVNIAERSGALQALAAGILLYIQDRVLWGTTPFSIPFWRERLESLVPASEQDFCRKALDFWEIRDTLNWLETKPTNVHYESMLVDFQKFDFKDSDLAFMVRMTRLALLGLTQQTSTALSEFDAMFQNDADRRMMLTYLGNQTKNRSTCDELRPPDQVVMKFFITWIGGIYGAHDLGNVLAGYGIHRHVDRFLKPLFKPNRPDFSQYLEVKRVEPTEHIMIR
jgi:tetratricopeptide (TPR) repeat protein